MQHHLADGAFACEALTVAVRSSCGGAGAAAEAADAAHPIASTVSRFWRQGPCQDAAYDPDGVLALTTAIFCPRLRPYTSFRAPTTGRSVVEKPLLVPHKFICCVQRISCTVGHTSSGRLPRLLLQQERHAQALGS